MKFLSIKLVRDLKRNWTQFFSVFLMAFLSVLVFVGLQGVWGGLEKSLNNFIDANGLADAWVYGTGFTENDIQSIEALDGIEKTFPQFEFTVSDLTNQASSSSSERTLTLRSPLGEPIAEPYFVQGSSFHESPGFIWINHDYAQANNLTLDQSLRIMVDGREIELTIAGMILTTDKLFFTGTQEYIAPDPQRYGYGILSEATLEMMLETSVLPNVVEVSGTSSRLRTEIESIMGERHIAYYDQATLTEVSEALGRVTQIQNLSFMFSFLFILLAILAMYTTIKRLIDTQTKEIAVLQALGFSNRTIGFHFTSFGLIIGSFGIAAGLAAAPLLSHFVLETQKNILSLPHWTVSYNSLSLIVCLLVLIICMASAYFASDQACTGLPADFLRGNTKGKSAHLLLEKLSFFWNPLSYEAKWGFRDAASNKMRVLMGIIGVAGGMMLITAGLGMPQSINHLVNKAYTEDFTYHQRINTSDSAFLEESFGQEVQILPTRFAPDDGYNRLLMIIDQGDFVHMKTTDNELITPGGIYLTEGFANRAGIQKGDQIEVFPAFHESSFRFEVSGIITSETNQGAYLLKKTWLEAGGTFLPQTLLVDEETAEALSGNPAITSTIARQDQMDNAYEFVDSLGGIFTMIIAFAVLLVIVVLYNLGTLNFVERTRDYTTLSVLGFRKKELRRITMIENAATTMVGWLIGIPAGSWFLSQYVSTFSTITIEYTAHFTWINVAIASMIVWLSSLSTTFLVSQRLKKLDLVSALKNVD
ncbi:ABC transporter permease [Enterococcus sp. RIT-PI-f]|uniref:ABC transporter permease n=1 Tax=Enterococcus sp. RIT-PI-f TaxID=1690244 RepID=UPI00356A9055